MAYAQEFTPEIDQDFLDRLVAQRERRMGAEVGRARGEAIGRGLGGDAYEASAVGLAREVGERDIADMMAEAAYRRAGLQREERMIGEGRDWQTGEREASQAWQREERAGQQAFSERMRRLGYELEADMASTANRRGMQDYLARQGIGFGRQLTSGALYALGGGSGGGSGNIMKMMGAFGGM